MFSPLSLSACTDSGTVTKKYKLKTVTCQVSHIMCHVSPVSCHMSITPTATATNLLTASSPSMQDAAADLDLDHPIMSCKDTQICTAIFDHL